MKGKVQQVIEDKRVRGKFKPATSKLSYRPKPLKAYAPVPLKPYTPVPIKPYIPKPLKPHKRTTTGSPPGPTSNEKCPHCGGDIVLKTDGRVMECRHCRNKVQYVPD